MERIQAKVEQLIKIAAKLWQDHDFSDITVKMNGRLSTTAGRAWLTTGLIEFSSKLYAENTEVFLEDTVPHEFAHIVAYRVYGSRGHDFSWKHVCSALGSDTQRCHTYAVAKKTVNTTPMYCGCMVHEFTPQRMAWVRKGKTYKCRNCGQVLKETK